MNKTTEFIKKYKKAGTVIGLLMLAIVVPLTALLISKSQDVRSRAGGGIMTLALSPESNTVAMGKVLTVSLNLDTAGFDASAIEMDITYDPNLLSYEPNLINGTMLFPYNPSPLIPNNKAFVTIKNELTKPGSIKFVGVNPTSKPITGSGLIIGELNFRAKAPGAAQIGFSYLHANAAGVVEAVTLLAKNREYTIVGGPSGIPTPSPSYICKTLPLCPPAPTGCKYSIDPTNCTCGKLDCNVPTCVPRPKCADADGTRSPICDPGPNVVWCPKIFPTPSCLPRPSCLDSNPRCMIAEPANGWCITTPTPIIVNCPDRIRGDFNCNGSIGLDDLLLWRDEYIATNLSRGKSDVVDPKGVGFEDLFIWRNSYIKQ